MASAIMREQFWRGGTILAFGKRFALRLVIRRAEESGILRRDIPWIYRNTAMRLSFGQDLSMRQTQSQKMVLAPRMIQSMEIL